MPHNPIRRHTLRLPPRDYPEDSAAFSPSSPPWMKLLLLPAALPGCTVLPQCVSQTLSCLCGELPLPSHFRTQSPSSGSTASQPLHCQGRSWDRVLEAVSRTSCVQTRWSPPWPHLPLLSHYFIQLHCFIHLAVPQTHCACGPVDLCSAWNSVSSCCRGNTRNIRISTKCHFSSELFPSCPVKQHLSSHLLPRVHSFPVLFPAGFFSIPPSENVPPFCSLLRNVLAPYGRHLPNICSINDHI